MDATGKALYARIESILSNGSIGAARTPAAKPIDVDDRRCQTLHACGVDVREYIARSDVNYAARCAFMERITFIHACGPRTGHAVVQWHHDLIADGWLQLFDASRPLGDNVAAIRQLARCNDANTRVIVDRYCRNVAPTATLIDGVRLYDALPVYDTYVDELRERLIDDCRARVRPSGSGPQGPQRRTTRRVARTGVRSRSRGLSPVPDAQRATASWRHHDDAVALTFLLTHGTADDWRRIEACARAEYDTASSDDTRRAIIAALPRSLWDVRCELGRRLDATDRSASPLRPDSRSASPLRPDGRSASPLRPDGRSPIAADTPVTAAVASHHHHPPAYRCDDVNADIGAAFTSLYADAASLENDDDDWCPWRVDGSWNDAWGPCGYKGNSDDDGGHPEE
jgi:hypothetical protein